MRLHLRPLGVSQNESLHPTLESQSSTDENPKSQQALARSQVSKGVRPKISVWKENVTMALYEMRT